MLLYLINVQLTLHCVKKKKEITRIFRFYLKSRAIVNQVDHSRETKEKSVRYLLRGTGSLYTDLLSRRRYLGE